MTEENDMVDGYRDGLDPNTPGPSGNRSESYLHGFANGRADLAGKSHAPAWLLRQQADQARAADAESHTTDGETE